MRPITHNHFLLTFVLMFLIIGFGNTAFAATSESIDTIQAHPPIHKKNVDLRLRRSGISPQGQTAGGLSPSQIKAIYNLPSSGGSGTIAIIGAYDSPNVEADLAVFNNQFGLPACTTANGCFEKHKMADSMAIDYDWVSESALDVQWAHAIAPDAKILLVQAKNSTLGSLLEAVDYARNRSDVVSVSMSWGGTEFPTESSYNSHFISPFGAQFFASAGDSGNGVLWPAVSSNVIGVGGTTLNFSGNNFVSETAWDGSGGGLSIYESEPDFQNVFGVASTSGFRAVPDVSYNADYMNSGFAVYDSYASDGWAIMGGTSAGVPQWAAIHALGRTVSNNTMYGVASDAASYSSDFRDITSGTNGVCGYYCTTQVGYDYVTGLGSPLTTNFVAPVISATITQTSGGIDIQIDTTTHAGGTGTWTNISGPTITETSAGQISTSTHTLTLPSGWEFNTAQQASIVVGGGTSFALATTTIIPGINTLTFNVNSKSISGNASIAFSNIQVRPTGSVAPTFGVLTHSGASIRGVDNATSFGSFSTAAGVPVSIGVETTPSGFGVVVQGQNISAGNSITAYSITRDQFGNFVSNIPVSWSLASKTGGISDSDLVVGNASDTATFTGHLIGTTQINIATSGLASFNSGIVTVILGTTTSIDISPIESTSTADASTTYSLIVNDAFGNSQDVSTSSTFTISDSAGGTFTGPTYIPGHVGDWTVTATYTGTTTTAELHITHGQIHNLAFTTQPINSIAGSVIPSVRVSMEDSAGNFIANATNTVSISINSNQNGAVLSGTTSVSAIDGVATFDGLSINKVASGYTLSASSVGLSATTSNTFNIVNANADHLVFTTQPANTTAGSNITSTVTVKDIYGNVATDFAGTITLYLYGSSNLLSGSTTTTAVSGVASFGSVHIDQEGTGYVLGATASGLIGATSTPFDVSVIRVQTSSGGGARSSGGGGGGGGGVVSYITPPVTISATSTITKEPVILPLVKNFSYSFAKDLAVGTVDSDVMQLQKFLNRNNFLIANIGPGSLGNETNSFGTKTKNALIGFQIANGIVPASGFLGPKTRGVINAINSKIGTSTTLVNPAAPAKIATIAVISTVVATSTTTYTRDLFVGSIGDDVSSLQRFLIGQNKGYAARILASFGATGRFGPVTRDALVEYQKAVGIFPSSGNFGPITRAMVSK